METKIKVGDDVQWMHVSSRGRSINFGTRYGKVVAVHLNEAHVRRNGKNEVVALRRLVPRNQPSPVNHVFGALTAHV